MNLSDRPAIILVAEDETLVRMLAVDILIEEGGFRVFEAVSADEALRILEARPDVRLLFTDVDMPGSLDGFALARLVDLRWPGIGIVVSSGHAFPGKADLPSKARFLAKPYSAAALIATVREVLQAGAAPIIIPEPQPKPVPIVPLPGLIDGPARPLPEPDEPIDPV
jgi:CheY-like chemotaxis protein